jgi:hypothetical protein
MAILFPSKTISAVNSRLNIPGGYIQFVDNTQAVGGTFTTAAWITFLSTSITMTNGSNRVLVDHWLNHRSDQGNGTWSLVYHRILRNGNQITMSGYTGSCANHIFYNERTFFDDPGAGTHTYTLQCLAHQGTAGAGTWNQTSWNINPYGYLRLFEYAV